MFIVFEGIDGCGKSTMVEEFHKYCKSNNITNLKIKFPNYLSLTGQVISNYLEGKFREDLNPWLIAGIFDADKFEYSTVLKHHITRNQVVLLDRYVMSNIAYSVNRIKDSTPEYVIDQLLYLNYTVFQLPKPDITFVLDSDMDNYIKVHKERDRKDILENDFELMANCRSTYKKLVERTDIGKVIEIPYIPISDRLELILSYVQNL